jgi:hypothetical protein
VEQSGMLIRISGVCRHHSLSCGVRRTLTYHKALHRGMFDAVRRFDASGGFLDALCLMPCCAAGTPFTYQHTKGRTYIHAPRDHSSHAISRIWSAGLVASGRRLPIS